MRRSTVALSQVPPCTFHESPPSWPTLNIAEVIVVATIALVKVMSRLASSPDPSRVNAAD